MKKVILTLVFGLGSLVAVACPPPTSHAVVRIGTTYDYNLDNNWSKELIGLGGTIGWEEPNRFVTISAIGNYTFGTKTWKAGGEITVNPLGIMLGYETPINANIIVGGGYKSAFNSAYTNVGLEVSGRVGSVISPYVRATYDMNNLGKGMISSVGMEIGFKFWLGQGW